MDIDKDFFLNIWCLLGLPFDITTLDQTTSEILSATNEHKSCFLSTPNPSYLSAAQTDNIFRKAAFFAEAIAL